MKTVLLLTHDDSGQESRLQAALDVTRALGGHLTCVDVIVPPVALGYGPYGDYSGAATAELLEDERQREKLNRVRLEARLAREDVAWSWKESVGFPQEALGQAAQLSDLIVLSTGLGGHEPSELRRLPARTAQNSHRPVLAIPPSAKGLDASGTALVAWDGSQQADEALRDAVPLLQLASHVILFDLDDSKAPFGAGDAAAYLSRHGIHARVECVERGAGETVCDAIREKARNVKAAYIVMGAFGHSPAIETVFGGVTRSMLTNCEIPLLVAH